MPASECEIFTRSTNEIVASVYSLSYAAPHLFADQSESFEADLRDLLAAASPTGVFRERARDIELVIWRKPAPDMTPQMGVSSA